MNSIVGVMQKVAEQEARKIYTTELGVITAVFPHASDSDKHNYQCSVKLKMRKQPNGSDFELRQVPVATQHMGLVNIPNVGDLVLVTFIGGDINAPIIIGRLHNDEDKPPVNKEKEFLLQHNLTEGGFFKIDEKGAITLTSKNEKNIVTIADDTDITLVNEKCNITMKSNDVTIANDQCTIKLSGGSINIDNGKCKITIEGGGITVDAATNSVNVKGIGGITLDAAAGNVTIKSIGGINIGDAATSSIQIGGRVPAGVVGDNDTLIFASHTHVGNLGAPCPIMVPTETVNSIQAKIRNTKAG